MENIFCGDLCYSLEKYSKLYKTTETDTVDLDVMLEKYRTAIESAIEELEFQQSPLSNEAKRVMKAGGKRLRPILVLISCEATSGQYTTAVPAAISYELAHEASLVQDDIIDSSAMRHNMETVHKKRGTTAAILISDLLIFDIFNQIAKYGETSLPKKKVVRLMAYVARAASQAIKGEFMEAALSKQLEISEKEYLEVAGLKTGALMAASCAAGAVVGRATEKVIDAMYRFGYNLGIAFQIRDDILDVTGDSFALGKPVMKDLQNNACNIVLVNALQNADTYKQNTIHSMLYKKWFAITDMQELRKVLEELKSIEYASKLQDKYTTMSRECLRALRGSTAKDKLLNLTYALELRNA